MCPLKDRLTHGLCIFSSTGNKMYTVINTPFSSSSSLKKKSHTAVFLMSVIINE